MSHEEVISNKIHSYTLDDVEKVALYLTGRTSGIDKALDLNAFADSVADSVIRTAESHTSDNLERLFVALKAALVLEWHALGMVEEAASQTGCDVLGMARARHDEVMRQAEEMLKSIRRD